MSHRLLFLALLLSFRAVAQISEGGTPPGLLPAHRALFAENPPNAIPIPFDKKKAWREDGEHPGETRFAAPVAVDISLANSGIWTTLPNGDRVWRCSLHAAGALGLVLLFDTFQLPAGAQFFAYTPDLRRTFGAYTTQSCTPGGQFLIGVLPGETTMLEYREPVAVTGQGKIYLNRIDYAYDRNALNEFDPSAADDFSQSQNCNVNVNCPAGTDWQVQKKGVARILMVFSNGSGWCTGSLMANTTNDGQPLFLTAHHCQLIGTNPNFAQWRFDFDYEASGCSNPGTEPTPKSVLGCQRLAYRTETDFMLLRLNPVPTSYGVYFNGWSRATTAPPRSTFIHHPVGDLKKISVDTNAATIFAQTIDWTGIFGISPANSHWKAIPDIGIYEPGSSGCPLFDHNKRVIGQLHGGQSNQSNACIVFATFFGRFDVSWNQGPDAASRLRDWLDPGNTAALSQNGYVQPIPTVFTISGNVKDYTGVNIPNLKVNLTGGATTSTTTDAAGNYTFANVPVGLNYTVKPTRDTNAINGVSTIDMVLISKHVLGIEALNSPWKVIAADINKSNSITTFDITDGRKVVLGVNTKFSSNTAWRFFPATLTFANPDNPFQNILPAELIDITNLQANQTGVNFIGVKIGDLNGNAIVGQ